jgi:hypothetical protein
LLEHGLNPPVEPGVEAAPAAAEPESPAVVEEPAAT